MPVVQLAAPSSADSGIRLAVSRGPDGTWDVTDSPDAPTPDRGIPGLDLIIAGLRDALAERSAAALDRFADGIEAYADHLDVHIPWR